MVGLLVGRIVYICFSLIVSNKQTNKQTNNVLVSSFGLCFVFGCLVVWFSSECHFVCLFVCLFVCVFVWIGCCAAL